MISPVLCPACDGACVAWNDDMLEPCAECDGTGRAVVVSPMASEEMTWRDAIITIDGVPMPAESVTMTSHYGPPRVSVLVAQVSPMASDDEGSAEE